jgi:putative membrane protein insertion efficiency factor
MTRAAFPLPETALEPSRADTSDRRPGLAARFLRRGILIYQYLFAWRPSPCRYVPTCSTYALDAVEQHGALRGSWLAVRRISRCHPWGGHGFDPVPARGHVPDRKSPR